MLLEDGEHGTLYANLQQCMAELEAGLRRAPEQLADVRRLLELAAKLIDTSGCQGEKRA